MQTKVTLAASMPYSDEKYGKLSVHPNVMLSIVRLYAYCVGQIILDARKQERMTQSDLAKKSRHRQNLYFTY